MIPYFILFFSISILSILGETVKDFKITPKMIFVILIFFAGFRFMVGIDFPAYMRIYDYTITKPEEVFVKEVGFIYLVKVLNFFNLDYQALFFITVLITQIYFYKFIKYFSPAIYISILIYMCIAPYYFFTFNGVRQGIAIAIFAYSLHFIVERNSIKYYIHILFAAFIAHATVLLMLPLYHVIYRHISMLKKSFIVIASFAGGYFFNGLISATPYAHFLTMSYNNISRSQTVYLFFIIAIIIFLTEKKTKEFKYKSIIYNLNMFIVIIVGNAILQPIDILYAVFLRMNNYFFIAYIILIPFLIQMIKNKNLRILSYILLIVLLFMYYAKTIVLNGEHHHLVPYTMGLDFVK